MNNNLDLTKLIGSLEKDGTKTMHLKGTKKNMDVYKIPLNYLYYNDQNDRIATWVNKFESEHSSITNLEKEAYNDEIQNYIKKADKHRFEKTKKNIQNFSQIEPGVVFSDGRIIDGNRRFCCLRTLLKETGGQSFGYFKAVILSKEISEKEIKLMELILQQGQEGKVDYNPIEKLVGIYRDIIKKKLFTLQEYATSIDSSIKDVEKSQEVANLMVDFLDYIHAPEQFYIAKELEIDGPLLEIYNIKKRIGPDENKWEKARISLYDNMLMKTNSEDSGDITRIIREFGKKIVGNDDLFNEYSSYHDEHSRELHNKLQDADVINTEYIRKEIRENDTLRKKMNDNLENVLYKAKRDLVRKQPIEALNMAIDSIEKIDLTAVSRLKNNDREDFERDLKLILEKINIIESKFHEII